MADEQTIAHSTEALTLPAASFNFQDLAKDVAHAHTLKTTAGFDNAMAKVLRVGDAGGPDGAPDIALPEGTEAKLIEVDGGMKVWAAVAVPAEPVDGEKKAD